MTEQQETNQVKDRMVLCHGQELKQLLAAGLAWLDYNHQSVNALNVFPVPDGDTGTNMLLTMRSAYSEIANEETNHVGKITQKIAHGALMGARGNSGVILSQIWRGLARELEDLEAFNTQQFAAAMREASETAYKGVVKPVEGTILTVIRQSAEAAEISAQASNDLVAVLVDVVTRGKQAVAETPKLLKVLADAGVVDAGGQGLICILEGMLRQLRGEELVIGQVVPTKEAFDAALAPHTGEEEYNYDVQFLIKGTSLDVQTIRETIDAMGDSTLVVGDEKLIKVHVHVDDPGTPISYGVSQGILLDVVVENMHAQYQDFVAAKAKDESGRPPLPIEKVEVIPGQIAAVAVAPGEGISEVFKSLGVAKVVAGGQTMNPSTEEIMAAMEEINTDKIIVLPNNKNIIMAAQNACELSSKSAMVVATRTIPQGVSALLALDPEGELEEVAEAMQEAASEVATGEITVATRDVELDGVKVENGHVLGLANGRIASAGPDIITIVKQTLMHMDVNDRELLTFYFGVDTTPQQAAELAEMVQDWYPHLEIEVVAGGQPHYYYIISAE